MPKTGRQREHAGDVQADREADDRQRRAVVEQVDGRHRHDRDHDAVRAGDREDRVARPRAAGRRWRSAGSSRRRDACATTRWASSSGSGRSPMTYSSDRRDLRDDREDVRAGERRHPDRLAEELARSDEIRAEHRADRRRPHDDREVAAAGRIGREIGGGEARLQVRGLPGADQQRRRRAAAGRRRPPPRRRRRPTPTSASSMPDASEIRRPRRPRETRRAGRRGRRRRG